MLETQLVSFCVNECGHEETLLSIDWGQMLIFSGDMPESSFNYNQVAFKGQTSHIYIKQIQTEGNSKHLEIFIDGFLVQALRLDGVVDHDGLVVYASRPNQLSFTDFGILENLKWGRTKWFDYYVSHSYGFILDNLEFNKKKI